MPHHSARRRRVATALVGAAVLGALLLGLFARWRDASRAAGPLERGASSYGRHDWHSAEQLARQHLKARKDDPEALRLLARSLFRQGKDQAALALCGRIADNFMAAEDYFLRGQALVRRGQRELGILVWRRALGRDADHVETLLALEDVMVQLDLLSEAARAAERLAAQPGWEARAALLLGKIRAEQSDPAGAAAALQRALAHPDQWHGADEPDRVRRQLARFLLWTGRPAEARAALRLVASPAAGSETSWLLSRCDLQEGRASDDGTRTQSIAYREAHPIEREPAPFVGESRCRDCHKTEYNAQHSSRHARTFLRPPFPSVALPEHAASDPANAAVTHTFSRRESQCGARTQIGENVYDTIFDYAFGSGDRGLTLIGRDSEDRWFEYRLSHYPGSVGWDVTSGQPARAAEPALYQGTRINADAVRRCLFCHTTNPRAISTRSGPESRDNAIGCERCHGPGGNHVQAIAARSADLAIARPLLTSGSEIVRLCSECHSPRDPNFKMTPGTLESVRFQGTTLTWSRCYSESRGMLDCVTCHNPHRDADTRAESYVAHCLECHAAPAPAASGSVRAARDPGHRRPVSASSCPVETKTNCAQCHMPKVKVPSAHTLFTDHFIRVHQDTSRDASTPL
jgi:tetratricopeptide (TPR) repeat protein